MRLSLLAILFCFACNPLAANEPRAATVTFILSFECPGHEWEYVERVVERFVLDNGFRLLNRNKLRREADINVEGIEIWGLDKRGRIFRAINAPRSTIYRIYVDNERPSEPDKEMENRMRNDIIYKNDCLLVNIARRFDDPSRRGQYQILKDALLRMFDQMKNLGKI